MTHACPLTALLRWTIDAQVPPFEWHFAVAPLADLPPADAPDALCTVTATVTHRVIRLPEALRAHTARARHARDAALPLAARIHAYVLTGGELNHVRNARLPLPPAGLLLAAYRVVHTADLAEAAACCQGFKAAPLLGFDAEWSRRGRRLTCVQLCDARVCLVFEPPRTPDGAGALLPEALVDVLCSETPKAGVALHNDAAVFERWGLALRGLVDVAAGARELGFRRDTGTVALVAWLLGLRLRKELGATFDGRALDAAQRDYAALDAVVAYRMQRVLAACQAHRAATSPFADALALAWEPREFCGRVLRAPAPRRGRTACL